MKREISLKFLWFKKDFIERLTFELGIGKSRGQQVVKAISPKEESGVTQRDMDTFCMFMKMQLLFVGVQSKSIGVQELKLKKINT